MCRKKSRLVPFFISQIGAHCCTLPPLQPRETLRNARSASTTPLHHFGTLHPCIFGNHTQPTPLATRRAPSPLATTRAPSATSAHFWKHARTSGDYMRSTHAPSHPQQPRTTHTFGNCARALGNQPTLPEATRAPSATACVVPFLPSSTGIPATGLNPHPWE
jgi:hypothetical protein